MDFSRPDNARKINRLKVLNALRKGDLSRAELSREIVLNKVSISEITDALIKEGLIESGMKDMSTQGRPSTKLSIAKKNGRVFSFVFLLDGNCGGIEPHGAGAAFRTLPEG